MSIFINILLAINLLVAILIILVTLMQRPKQEGLGAAFGGGMTENLFGAQTTNVLQTITRWLGGLFFVLTLTISAIYARQATSKSSIQKQLLEQPLPAASAAPVPGTPEAAPAETVTPAETAPAPEAPTAPAETAPEAPAAPVEATTPASEAETPAASEAPAAAPETAPEAVVP